MYLMFLEIYEQCLMCTAQISEWGERGIWPWYCLGVSGLAEHVSFDMRHMKWLMSVKERSALVLSFLPMSLDSEGRVSGGNGANGRWFSCETRRMLSSSSSHSLTALLLFKNSFEVSPLRHNCHSACSCSPFSTLEDFTHYGCCGGKWKIMNCFDLP